MRCSLLMPTFLKCSVISCRLRDGKSCADSLSSPMSSSPLLSSYLETEISYQKSKTDCIYIITFLIRFF